MILLYSDSCLAYKKDGHAESPDRIGAVAKHLKQLGYIFVTPHPCLLEDVLLVHSEAHLRNIETGDYSDPDTPALSGILDHALVAAGSAIQAAGYAMQGQSAFSLMRPPGHHATQNKAMGFCYFNNVAIAAARYLKTNPTHKVAILDFDCHHGNGTEDIFLGHDKVLYVSLHQRTIFPETGLLSKGNCVNFPLEPDTSDETYLDVLDRACKNILDFKPNVLGVSAGFDAYQGDPLSQMQLDSSTFEKIGRKIKSMQLPVFAVMEGGYSTGLPQCVALFLKGLTEK